MQKKLPKGKVLRLTARCVEIVYGPREGGGHKATLLLTLDKPPKPPYKNSFKVDVPYDLGLSFVSREIDITIRPKE